MLIYIATRTGLAGRVFVVNGCVYEKEGSHSHARNVKKSQPRVVDIAFRGGTENWHLLQSQSLLVSPIPVPLGSYPQLLKCIYMLMLTWLFTLSTPP